MRSATDLAAIAIDIPIGLTLDGAREADKAAERLLGTRAQCVFGIPSRQILEAANYEEAVQRATRKKPSAQAFALGKKILGVNDSATLDQRVHEVHPEVSFTTMNKGSPLASKKPWNGFWQRRRLLTLAGIEIPSELAPQTGCAGSDDILDVGAAAWTALRIAAGRVSCLPDPPEELGGRPVAIWY